MIMKYIRTYENINKKYKIGDYLYFKRNDSYQSISFNNFIENHIAKIINKDDNTGYLYVNFIFNDNDTDFIKNEFNHNSVMKKSDIINSSQI